MTKNSFMKNLKKLGLDKKVVNAFNSTDRELFFDTFFKDRIYGFDPIPIGHGEESDEVGILAKMINLLNLEKTDSVLEIGTGSGYSTAVISSMVNSVVTIDINETLVLEAKKRLIDSGHFNTKYLAGDCSELDDRAGFFDKVIIHAACMHSPYAALNLLRKEGVAIYPMGPANMQQLTLYENKQQLSKNPFGKYRFLEICSCPSIKGQYSSENQEIDIIMETGSTGE